MTLEEIIKEFEKCVMEDVPFTESNILFFGKELVKKAYTEGEKKGRMESEMDGRFDGIKFATSLLQELEREVEGMKNNTEGWVETKDGSRIDTHGIYDSALTDVLEIINKLKK